jgi:hypothetical protein
MSFRMAADLGLNVDAQPMNEYSRLSDEDIDARRITFWGCFLFDKCWSNYLGRQPQLQLSHITMRKPEVFASEDSELWSPYTDAGIVQANAQPARTRTVALQISKLAEISGDLLASFYHPSLLDKPLSKPAELKRLSDIHTRLEAWKKELPPELEAKDSQLPQVLLMHMFYQLLYIHLYRPFLRYTKHTSPLPAHISPRKFCTQAAGAISKLFRLYKRTHGLRQICNIAIYIIHTACTIHTLNMPDKNAKRDIVHGVKHLEEMGECWTAARRNLDILRVCVEKWKVDIPEEADMAFARAKLKWSVASNSPSPPSGPFGSMIGRMNSAPMSELLAQNLQTQQDQQQQPHPQHRPQQAYQQQSQRHQNNTSFDRQSSIAQIQPGLSAGMAPSPAETVETRRSSGNMSLPPTSAVDFSRGTNRIRPSTNLTKAQQDAWSMHQARLNSLNAGTNTYAASMSASAQGDRTANANAARLFGGVESLIEDSQEWWFRDQSQLATGFDNWNAPSQDWYAGGPQGAGMDGGQIMGDGGAPATSAQMLDPIFGVAGGLYAQQHGQYINGPSSNELAGGGGDANGIVGNGSLADVVGDGKGHSRMNGYAMRYDDDAFY